MATVKFFLRGGKTDKTIYVRLNINASLKVIKKLPYKTKEKDWNTKSGLPKLNDPTNKNLNVKLIKLQHHVLQFYQEEKHKEIINANWLDSTIKFFLEPPNSKKTDYLLDFIASFVEELKIRKDVTEATFKKYRTISDKVKHFEMFKGKKYLLHEVNSDFGNVFFDFLISEEKLKRNTAGRYIKFFKTFMFSAQKKGCLVDESFRDIKGLKEKVEKYILSFEEIKKIAGTTMPNTILEEAKKWLIIGCYTGQRVSDLLRMKKSMIQQVGEFEFIVIEQVKTKKTVQIPIHSEVKKILEENGGDFPDSFGKTGESANVLFNRYIKEVCRIAGIDEQTTGYIFSNETKRKEKVTEPKYKFVTSHICRRSFATNFYTIIPTPLLMNITAHGTETMFLEYIGKKGLDFSIQLAKMWQNT